MGDKPYKVEDDVYESYTPQVTKPFGSMDLELGVDAVDYETILEYRNFDPKKLMMILIIRASESNTSPEEFHKEINRLIQLIRTAEDYGSYYLTTTNFRQLENKYGVSHAGHESDIITHKRLRLMFPHYYLSCIPDAKKQIPEIFAFPEFGVIIPEEDYLTEDVRTKLIQMHIYFQQQGYNRPTARTLSILWIRRSEKTQLSNNRRVRLLHTLGVLSRDGILSAEAITAYEDMNEKGSKSLVEIRYIVQLLLCRGRTKLQ